MTLSSKKWSINSEMGFIEVDINFFIGLKINSKTFYEIQSDFSMVSIETDGGKLIIEVQDWLEIQSELRTIQIDRIIGTFSV